MFVNVRDVLLFSINQKILGDADISAGNVVPLRRRILECQLINSWSDIQKVA